MTLPSYRESRVSGKAYILFCMEKQYVLYRSLNPIITFLSQISLQRVNIPPACPNCYPGGSRHSSRRAIRHTVKFIGIHQHKPFCSAYAAEISPRCWKPTGNKNPEPPEPPTPYILQVSSTAPAICTCSFSCYILIIFE